MHDFAAPVKGILKALDNATKLSKRVSKFAGSVSGEEGLKISQAAHNLQSVLEESSKTIQDAYEHKAGQCGELFAEALVEDKSLQFKLKELRIDLIDQINECDFDEDEPFNLELAALESIKLQAERSCNECIDIFNNVGDRLLQVYPRSFTLDNPRDDRAILSSMRAVSRGGRSGNVVLGSKASPLLDKSILAFDAPPLEPKKPGSSWTIEGGPRYDKGGQVLSGAYLNSASVTQGPYRADGVLMTSPLSEETSLRRGELNLPDPAFPLDQAHTQPVSDTSCTSDNPSLIGKEVVRGRLSQNEQFLERRRQSRLLFQNEMRMSISSIEEHRASPSSDYGSIISSPKLEESTMLGKNQLSPSQKASSSSTEKSIPIEGLGSWRERLVLPYQDQPSLDQRNQSSEAHDDGFSPISGVAGRSISPNDGRTSRLSLNGYDTMMDRQRSQRHTSQTTRSSRTSSILQDIRLQDQSNLDRKDSHASQASQESIFGLRNSAPLSPPLSEHRTSGNERWDHLATTLRVPGFGEGVEPGIEVVDNIDRNSGLILANEAQFNQTAHTASMKFTDCPMRYDSSFYKFGGFCDGAKALTRGEIGFRVMKRPSGHYSATVSARCLNCSYEVGWNEVEKDRVLDPKGIYGNSGIRFRQKFISKCHLRTNSVDVSIYACIFCIEEHRTVEEHDATVFFSVTQLFQHLAKHSRPLPNVAGLSVLYGYQSPHVVDFDIHFTSSEPKFGKFAMSEIAPKAITRPAAHASATHHPKTTSSGFRDPEGNGTLHFASGARIVGISFPEQFKGQWLVGYHDGERGSFPANTVILEMPARDDVLMNAQSNLVAFARWDFKPKDAKDGGWLKFSKGDRISAVGYIFQDQWCWTGQTGAGSKAKFGLFPAAFVEGLKEDDGAGPVNGKLGSSPGSLKTGLGFGGLGGLLGRHKSSRGHERSASVRSSGSAGSGSHGVVAIPNGLEVVQSPLHPVGSWRTFTTHTDSNSGMQTNNDTQNRSVKSVNASTFDGEEW